MIKVGYMFVVDSQCANCYEFINKADCVVMKHRAKFKSHYYHIYLCKRCALDLSKLLKITCEKKTEWEGELRK